MRTVRKQRGRHARRAAAPLRAGTRRTPAKRPAPRTTSEKNLSQYLSLYSLTSSHVHSALNTLASIALVANSAFAFAAIAIKGKPLASEAICVFVLSLIFYSFSLFLYIKENFEIFNALLEEKENIPFLLNRIHIHSLISICFAVFPIIVTIGFFILLVLGFFSL